MIIYVRNGVMLSVNPINFGSNEILNRQLMTYSNYAITFDNSTGIFRFVKNRNTADNIFTFSLRDAVDYINRNDISSPITFPVIKMLDVNDSDFITNYIDGFADINEIKLYIFNQFGLS